MRKSSLMFLLAVVCGGSAFADDETKNPSFLGAPVRQDDPTNGDEKKEPLPPLGICGGGIPVEDEKKEEGKQ